MTITREQVIAWAREAGLRLDKHNGGFIDQSALIRFATLIEQAVRHDENEQCAALCDRFANRAMSADECADAIRTRQGAKK